MHRELPVSRDGRWAIVQKTGPDQAHPYSLTAYPIEGGPSVTICLALCWADWDQTGKFFYVGFPNIGDNHGYALPVLQTGLPNLSPTGILSKEDLKKLKGVELVPGVTASRRTPSFLFAPVRRLLLQRP